MPRLDWTGREESEGYADRVAPAELKPVPELSSDEGSQNVLVCGENLRVLKELLPECGGSVDLVFIDSPYNARDERWIFPDFLLDWRGKTVGAEGEDPLRHDKWLSMMYPRLRLLRDMLSERGSLWMTLDDHAIHHARLLMDEVFGRENFVACVTWERGEVEQGNVVEAHNYVLVYARDAGSWKPANSFPTIWPASEVGTTRQAAEELRGLVGTNADSLPAPPKPLQLLRRIVCLASRPDSLVLDCFAGSGATGHAILEQNAADGEGRRFVLVESERATAELAAGRLRRVPDSAFEFYSAR